METKPLWPGGSTLPAWITRAAAGAAQASAAARIPATTPRHIAGAMLHGTPTAVVAVVPASLLRRRRTGRGRCGTRGACRPPEVGSFDRVRPRDVHVSGAQVAERV